MDYIVVKNEFLTVLMEMVLDFMKEGFRPCGGVSVDPSDKTYMQAMCKDVPHYHFNFGSGDKVKLPDMNGDTTLLPYITTFISEER